jgi:hypothetical protein
MIWKTLVYDYVHNKNQMEIDYSIEPLLPIVADESYLKEQQQRLARRHETDRDRHLIPIKSETRLKILHACERQDEVIAEVELKRSMVSHIRNEPQTERRVERQRLYLSRGPDKWHINKVQELTDERAFTGQPEPAQNMPQAADASDYGMISMPSIPFLNRHLLGYPEPALRRIRYDRARAVQYADAWWNGHNPAFLTFEVDCTNFISQCLYAGGAPMHYTGKRDSGWWYKGRINGRELWSFSWAVANSFLRFFLTSKSGLRAQEVGSPRELTWGDVIVYDWDGDGRYQHSTIITAIDPNGMPLVNAHTVSSQHRYWAYTDSPSWTPRTRYRFLHIPDFF